RGLGRGGAILAQCVRTRFQPVSDYGGKARRLVLHGRCDISDATLDAAVRLRSAGARFRARSRETFGARVLEACLFAVHVGVKPRTLTAFHMSSLQRFV